MKLKTIKKININLVNTNPTMEECQSELLITIAKSFSMNGIFDTTYSYIKQAIEDKLCLMSNLLKSTLDEKIRNLSFRYKEDGSDILNYILSNVDLSLYKNYYEVDFIAKEYSINFNKYFSIEVNDFNLLLTKDNVIIKDENNNYLFFFKKGNEEYLISFVDNLYEVFKCITFNTDQTVIYKKIELEDIVLTTQICNKSYFYLLAIDIFFKDLEEVNNLINNLLTDTINELKEYAVYSRKFNSQLTDLINLLNNKEELTLVEIITFLFIYLPSKMEKEVEECKEIISLNNAIIENNFKNISEVIISTSDSSICSPAYRYRLTKPISRMEVKLVKNEKGLFHYAEPNEDDKYEVVDSKVKLRFLLNNLIEEKISIFDEISFKQ